MYQVAFSYPPHYDHECPEARLGKSSVSVARNLDALTDVVDHQLRHQLDAHGRPARAEVGRQAGRQASRRVWAKR